MKKKKKAITIILIVFILVFGFIFGGYFAIKTVMTKGAINYLQDKYNMSYNQITVLIGLTVDIMMITNWMK